MKLYLDLCCYNRPFDDQSDIRIKLEAEAKLYIQERMKAGQYQVVWSYILDYENMANPFEERREAIKFWRSIAVQDADECDQILALADEIGHLGLKAKDALHIGCAINCRCDYFLTTDDAIIRKMKSFERIKVLNPLEFINTEVKHGK